MTDDLFETAEEGPGGELPKDQWGRYRLPTPGGDGKLVARTRVTTFAKSISDTFVLNQWSQRMIMLGLAKRRDLFTLVTTLTEADRDRLNGIAEEAKTAANARAAANLGTAMHTFAEVTDKTGKPPATLPPELAPILAARQRALADHRIVMVPDMIERTVYCPRWDVVGTFDRWGFADVPDQDPAVPQADNWPGEIMDDKTGRDLTYGQLEIAIQEACYANAEWILDKDRFWETVKRDRYGKPIWANPDCWSPMPATRTDRALVIHMPVKAALDAPTAPPQVTIYQVNIGAGAEAADFCAKVRWWRKRKDLFAPLSVTAPASPVSSGTYGPTDAVRQLAAAERDTEEVYATGAPNDVLDAAILAEQEAARMVTRMVTRPPTWEEKIRAATSQAALSKIWREATRVGEWTKELEKLGLDQLSKVNNPT